MSELILKAPYSDAVAERFSRPPAVAGTAISGSAGSLAAGAVIRFSADLNAAHLCNMGFRAWACPHIIAACSLVAERLEGAAPQQLADPALAEMLAEMLKELEIPVEKTGKILILQDALRACYEDFESQLESH